MNEEVVTMQEGPGKRNAGDRGRTGPIIVGIVAMVLILISIGIGYRIGSRGEQAEMPHGDQAAGVSQAVIWTCSMHPQIRQPKPGRCPICGMDLIPVTDTEGDQGA
ncbi:MAG: heavy metal-binding domain-containing protein, partial [bacterium]